MKWTREDREPYVDPLMKRVDNVEDYVENLVAIWHAMEEDDVRLYDFLGLEEREITPWVHGKVPDRITLMWSMGDY